MKLSHLFAALFAGAMLLAPGLISQTGGGVASAQSANQIALLDVAKVFAEHVRFKQEMEAIKKEAEAFGQYAQGQDTRLKQLMESLEGKTPGSLDYRKIDEEMARIRSETGVQSQLKQKEFVTREAKIFHKYYTEIQQVVADYAARNRVSLVLRWDSQTVEPTNRMSVQAAVNNSVVLQRGRDITPYVLQVVNKGQDQARVQGPLPR